MKLKFVFIFLSILSVFNLFSQKKLTKEEKGASDIIGFCNTIINMGNSYHRQKNSYNTAFSDIKDNMVTIRRKIDRELYNIPYNTDTISRQQVEEYENRLSIIRGFDQKNELKNLVGEAQSNIISVEKWYSAICEYFGAKEYNRDNNYLRYDMLEDSLSFYLDKAEMSWSRASRKATDVGNRAELFLLSKMKIADFVLPMKTDLIGINDILRLLENDTPDLAFINKKISDLSSSIDSHKNLSGKKTKALSHKSYKQVYVDFYQSCAQCVSDLQMLTGNIEHKDNEKQLFDTYTAVISSYRNAMNHYNKFIDQR